MAFPRPSSGDLPLASGLLATGIVLLAIASRQGPAAFHFIPAMDGCLTMGVAGFCLALAAGVPYQQALTLLVPIAGAQVLGARMHQASVFAVFGIEAAVFGVIGAALALYARPAPAPQPAPVPQPQRQALRRHGAVHAG
jgi:hypothetical protein